jgi:RHS repeat-associated protein
MTAIRTQASPESPPEEEAQERTVRLAGGATVWGGGWYNSGFRDYSPMQMRFTTVDPVRSGSNWYAYVGGDPVNYVDPWGLEASDSAAALGQWGSGGTATPAAGAPGARLLQTDPSIRVRLPGVVGGANVNMMATRGCFFMSALGTAQTETGVTLSATQILDIVNRTQASGAVNADMSVNPNRVADVVNTALDAAGSGSTATVAGYTGYTGQYDAALVQGWTVNNNPHWREGNASGEVVWDPYPTAQLQAGQTATAFVYLEFTGGGP